MQLLYLSFTMSARSTRPVYMNDILRNTLCGELEAETSVLAGSYSVLRTEPELVVRSMQITPYIHDVQCSFVSFDDK